MAPPQYWHPSMMSMQLPTHFRAAYAPAAPALQPLRFAVGWPVPGPGPYIPEAATAHEVPITAIQYKASYPGVLKRARDNSGHWQEDSAHSYEHRTRVHSGSAAQTFESSRSPVRAKRLTRDTEAERTPQANQKIGKTVIVTRMVKPAYDCTKCGQPKRGHVCTAATASARR